MYRCAGDLSSRRTANVAETMKRGSHMKNPVFVRYIRRREQEKPAPERALKHLDLKYNNLKDHITTGVMRLFI